MDGDLVASLSRHCDVFRQLSDREPVNSTEAQAVIENIRAEKGYLDDETLEELNTLGPRTKERLLRIINLKRETEAAYTTRYGIHLAVMLFANCSQYLRTTVLVQISILVRVDPECRRFFVQKVPRRKYPTIPATQSYARGLHLRDE
jgi:hypothetical protein